MANTIKFLGYIEIRQYKQYFWAFKIREYLGAYRFSLRSVSWRYSHFTADYVPPSLPQRGSHPPLL